MVSRVRPFSLRNHIPALDGIRGLALTLVLVHHLLWANDQTGSRVFNALSALRGASWVGVDLFFALSGFLITGILYDSLQEEGYFRNFYARRTLRIFPLYYGFLALLLLLTHPLRLHWHGMQWPLLFYMQNTGWFTSSIAGFTPSPNINLNHFWSLAVEEQFYLVWPLLVFWIRDWKRLVMATLGLSVAALVLRIVLLSHGASGQFLYCFTLCRADTLLLGGCLALVMRSRWKEQAIAASRPLLFTMSLVLISVGIYTGSFDWSRSRFIPTFGFSLIALAAVSLIAETFRSDSWTRPFLESRPLRFLGRYSYGIYVFHYSLDASLTAHLRSFFLLHTHSKAMAVVFSAATVATLSILLALLSFHFFESPFLRLKKRFESRKVVVPAAA